MEHVLRVHAELLLEAERLGVVLLVLRELGAQSDEAAVQPPHDVSHLFKRQTPTQADRRKKTDRKIDGTTTQTNGRTGRQKNRQTNGQKQSYRYRDKDRHTEIEIQRYRDRQIQRYRDTEIQRQTDGYRDRDTDRQTGGQIGRKIKQTGKTRKARTAAMAAAKLGKQKKNK